MKTVWGHVIFKRIRMFPSFKWLVYFFNTQGLNRKLLHRLGLKCCCYNLALIFHKVTEITSNRFLKNNCQTWDLRAVFVGVVVSCVGRVPRSRWEKLALSGSFWPAPWEKVYWPFWQKSHRPVSRKALPDRKSCLKHCKSGKVSTIFWLGRFSQGLAPDQYWYPDSGLVFPFVSVIILLFSSGHLFSLQL